MTNRARFASSGFVKSSGLDIGPLWGILKKALSAAVGKLNQWKHQKQDHPKIYVYGYLLRVVW